MWGMRGERQFVRTHAQWIDEALKCDRQSRQLCWSSSIAVGNECFVEEVKANLGVKSRGRAIYHEQGRYMLKEPRAIYHSGLEKSLLRAGNTYLWDRT